MEKIKLFDELLPKIEQRLDMLIPENGDKFSAARQAMRYSLLCGGKRIRPVLLLEFYRLCGGKSDCALNFAAAIEMIHTYSLIHDDLPCMDDDDMRRGKLSCHRAFGEDTALLAGDALLTLAFSAAARSENLPPERVLRAISVLADNAGIDGMVGGQVMDLKLEETVAKADELKEMYLKKTSCLLKAAAVCGCVLAGADEEYINCAGEYADSLGLAFQIIDDILDCTADEKTLGKPIGSDAKNGKTTYVTLYGIDGAQKKAAELSENAERLLERFKGDSTALKELTKYLLDRRY